MKKSLLYVFIAASVLIGGRLLFLANSDSEAPRPEPMLSVIEILNASDLNAGITLAVETDNQDAIDDWIEQVVALAEQAHLSDEDIEYLESPQARDYLIFKAKRSLFNRDFEYRYVNLLGIDDLVSRYPEAHEQIQRAYQLIEKRDQIIQLIAQELAAGGEVKQVHIDAAKDNWVKRYNLDTQPTPNP